MKNRFLKILFLFSISTSTHISAQNAMLLYDKTGSYSFIGPCEDEDLKRNDGGLVNSRQYKIPTVPEELSTLAPELHLDYKKGLNRLLNSFQLEHINYRQMVPAYSFFGLGNYYVMNILPYNDQSTINQDSVSRATLFSAVFKKKGILEIIYSWAMPLYQNAFAAMSVPEQEDYLKLLNDTKNYAINFDLLKEKKALDSLSDQFANSKGKTNAFVFRRIVNNQISKQECIAWLTKIITDLESVRRKSNSPSDNYVLYSQMDGNYFLAADYKDVMAYLRKTRIIHSFNGKSELLDEIYFEKIQYGSSDLVLGPSEKTNNGKKMYRLFYSDSSGYNSFLLSEEAMGINDIVLGTGTNKRILLMNGADATQSHVLCTVYDLDSGFVVLKSVWIAADAIQDPNSSQVLYYLKLTGGMLLYEEENGMKGLLNQEGKIILSAKYKSITCGKKEGEFILDKKKHILLN